MALLCFFNQILTSEIIVFKVFPYNIKGQNNSNEPKLQLLLGYLRECPVQCKMSCRFTEWNCQDDWSKLDGVADNLDTSSFEKLILSTGFSLD